MFVSIAHAMGGVPTGAGGTDAFMQFVPLLLMLAIFYFLLIRPQQKRAKQHRAMLEALKKGDYVLTTGGIVGRILEVDGDMLVLDLGETRITVARSFVSGLTENRIGGRKGGKRDREEKDTTTEENSASEKSERIEKAE